MTDNAVSAHLPKGPYLTTESLAYWFFRLNGCLTTVNFLVHHERRGYQGTDVDILATRFPFRQELAMSNRPMQDHPVFSVDGLIDVIIAEVKSGRCALNGPWTDSDKSNMQRVLYAVGVFPPSLVERAAQSLYSDHYYQDARCRLRLFALGREINRDLAATHVVQLTWDQIIEFIHSRLRTYRDEKSQHSQWDKVGQWLYHRANEHRQVDQFAREVFEALDVLPTAGREDTTGPIRATTARWSREPKVKEVVWEAVLELTDGDKTWVFAPRDLNPVITQRYPDFNLRNVTPELIAACANHPSRHHFREVLVRYWWIGHGQYRLFDPDSDQPSAS